MSIKKRGKKHFQVHILHFKSLGQILGNILHELED